VSLKKIIILGAGYAGVLTAKKLAKKTKNNPDIDITIIDKNPFHTMLTELHEVAAQRVEEDSIRINLERVFAGRKVRVVHDTVTKLDFENRQLEGAHGVYSYDYLVLSAGSRPAFFGTSGAKENSFTLWSYEDALRLREHIESMFRKASVEPDIDKKRELLTFYIVGTGFTGVEMAGELAEFVPVLCNRHEVDRSLITMVDVDMLPRACALLPEKQADKVVRRLEKTGVRVMLKTNIKGVGEDYIEYDNGSGLERQKTHTVIWTAGVEGSQVAQDSAALGAAGRGRVQTDEFLQSQNDKNVYVAGDNIFYIPEGEKAPVPQMVENAECSADVVAHNLAVDLTGKGEKEAYKPKFHGVMVCVGGRWGTAYGGLPNHFFGMPSFIAMFAKHFINVTYFIKVLGWNKIFSYIKHEFFTVRNRRSFLGGHFSNRGPNFLLVPLRVFFGLYWVYEGAMKIRDGWLSNPRLNNFFTSANNWYAYMLGGGKTDTVTSASVALDPLHPRQGAVADALSSASRTVADALSAASGTVTDALSAASGTAADAVSAASGTATDALSAASGSVADAVSAASGAVTDALSAASGSIADAVSAASGAAYDAVSAASGSVADALTAASGRVIDALSAASSAVAAAVGSNKVLIDWDFLWFFKLILIGGKSANEVASKVQVSFVDGIINAILPHTALQMTMQIVIVLLEILLGLALAGGMFTTLAAAGTLLLQLMFLTSTGIYMSSWWMLFASIAMMFGAGQVFSFDYYLMPWLKKYWQRIKFAKKW